MCDPLGLDEWFENVDFQDFLDLMEEPSNHHQHHQHHQQQHDAEMQAEIMRQQFLEEEKQHAEAAQVCGLQVR